MLTKLSETSRFKSELRFFQIGIEKIQNEDAKKSASIMLNELLAQTRLIDEGHSSRNNGYVNPRALKDSIERIADLRKRLRQLLNDSK